MPHPYQEVFLQPTFISRFLLCLFLKIGSSQIDDAIANILKRKGRDVEFEEVSAEVHGNSYKESSKIIISEIEGGLSFISNLSAIIDLINV
jgi:hypothetical protein